MSKICQVVYNMGHGHWSWQRKFGQNFNRNHQRRSPLFISARKKICKSLKWEKRKKVFSSSCALGQIWSFSSCKHTLSHTNSDTLSHTNSDTLSHTNSDTRAHALTLKLKLVFYNCTLVKIASSFSLTSFPPSSIVCVLLSRMHSTICDNSFGF